MAVPRVFISSTCYDLQEIRFQLRRFIEDFGYEPVMSEFGDIFYDLSKHVQDACKDEISKSNLFILIIGNNYGSLYYKHNEEENLPDSITLQEFRKALEVGVPKYIFINKFVQYDYENYKRALSTYFTKYFSKHSVPDAEINSVKNKLKETFDSSYPFPQDAYKYVFYFLDILYSLDINNALYSFESFEDIRDTLRKQWAGFVYDALTKERTVSVEKIEDLKKRLEKIESLLKTLTESSKATKDNKITIDLEKIISEIDIDELEKIQEKIDNLLSEILTYYNNKPRLKIKKEFDDKLAENWLSHLSKVVHNFKWSKFVPITEIVKGVPFSYWKDRSDVPYKALLELLSIVRSLSDEDRKVFLKTVVKKFNDIYEPEPEDDFPF